MSSQSGSVWPQRFSFDSSSAYEKPLSVDNLLPRLLTLLLVAFFLQTEAVKPVLGKYYREPEKSKGPIPVHLVKPLVESFQNDHVVPDEGEIVYYKKAF